MLALQVMQKFNIYSDIAVCDSTQQKKTFYSTGAATKAVSNHSCFFFNIIYLIGHDLADSVSARMIFTMFCDK